MSWACFASATPCGAESSLLTLFSVVFDWVDGTLSLLSDLVFKAGGGGGMAGTGLTCIVTVPIGRGGGGWSSGTDIGPMGWPSGVR